MQLTETIEPSLHTLRTRVQASKRTDPNDPTLAGWGQFLEAEGHKEQIGPYGTCAAILLNSILTPNIAEDTAVVSQIEKFWDDPVENRKLKFQNVRVAFLVLALANSTDARLKRVLEEAIALLEGRQLADGSWGDWADDASNAPPRVETTAWILFALNRAGTGNSAAAAAQTYLNSLVGAVGNSTALSNFAMGVLLVTLPKGNAKQKLLASARAALSAIERGDFEQISFFDYLENPGGNEAKRVRRDYLCYPLVLPFALLTAGVAKHSGWLGALLSSVQRMKLSDTLRAMIGSGSYFKLPGASFPSTVDQAAVALSFENLRHSEYFYDANLSAIRPLISWARTSFLLRVAFPLVLAVAALFAIEDPKLLATPIPQSWSWIDKTNVTSFLEENERTIRLAGAVFLFFANSIPGRILTYIRERWWY